MIISIASGKGGTGKTTVATNLAVSVLKVAWRSKTFGNNCKIVLIFKPRFFPV